MIGWRSKPSLVEVDKPKGFDDYDLRLGDLMRGERATLGKSLLDVQRELKIKAAYIAAIENADISAFETQGFVAGYVRSYARYLGMDPDWAFQRFCKEARFEVAHGMSAAASSSGMTAARTRQTQEFRDPLANPNATFVPKSESLFAQVEPGAVGSVLVLVALIGAIGYGGWSVLQEVQRVQLAPVDQAPVVRAEIDPLGNVAGTAPLVRSAPLTESAELAANDPVQQADGMDRLYRPQALDVPLLTSRDGPIAGINPRGFAAATQPGFGTAQPGFSEAIAEAVAESVEVVQVVADAKPGVEILAVRPSWVRVEAADGTVLFEKILDAGERWAVPITEEPPLLRSGNSGSVYFAVNGQTYGPAAPGPQVVKNVDLSPEALVGKFALADLTVDPDLAAIVAVADASELVAPEGALPVPVSE